MSISASLSAMSPDVIPGRISVRLTTIDSYTASDINFLKEVPRAARVYQLDTTPSTVHTSQKRQPSSMFFPPSEYLLTPTSPVNASFSTTTQHDLASPSSTPSKASATDECLVATTTPLNMIHSTDAILARSSDSTEMVEGAGNTETDAASTTTALDTPTSSSNRTDSATVDYAAAHAMPQKSTSDNIARVLFATPAIGGVDLTLSKSITMSNEMSAVSIEVQPTNASEHPEKHQSPTVDVYNHVPSPNTLKLALHTEIQTGSSSYKANGLPPIPQEFVPPTTVKEHHVDISNITKNSCNEFKSPAVTKSTKKRSLYRSTPLIYFPDALTLLSESAVAVRENRIPPNGVAPSQRVKINSQNPDAPLSFAPEPLSCPKTTARQSSDESILGIGSTHLRQGISRYAPYGTRFRATMKDGSIKKSHIAGDLADRARVRPGRGTRVDLVLEVHQGEMDQLESAWIFCEDILKSTGVRPGPSEVLGHLRHIKIDHDYRKDSEAKLLQRNASNFYKRMIEYGRRLQSTVAVNHASSSITPDVVMMDKIDYSAVQNNSVPVAVTNHFVEPTPVLQIPKYSNYEGVAAILKAAMEIEGDAMPGLATGESLYKYNAAPSIGHTAPTIQRYESANAHCFVPSEVIGHVSPTPLTQYTDGVSHTPKTDFDFNNKDIVAGGKVKGCQDKKYPYGLPSPLNMTATSSKKYTPRKRSPARQNSYASLMTSGSTASDELSSQFLKNMLRLLPLQYQKLSRLPLLLQWCALRTARSIPPFAICGEINQLESGWEFIQVCRSAGHPTPGATALLDHLRQASLDFNFRQNGSKLLQKNAGNLFKRVQEFGKRRLADPNYLLMVTPDQSEISQSYL
ncbi:hypothetical protein BSLG_003961 [Batrachochytrium salamandrivorans]|nr:hypothetical protein BSLG_003961 [Batrachochytrium salamandrivorans]